MKKSLLFYPVGRILLLVGAYCVGLLLPFEMRAATKNVWIEYEVDTHESPQDMTVCIGQEKLFTAETAHPPGSSWSWSGATISGSATNHPTSDALKTFSTAGGPFSVTATYNSETSHAARVTVVEVASLTPNAGTLISGSSPPTYVVCLGTGDVTVTATPNPSLAEGSLPSCWGFIGGNAVGSGLLQRKVTKTTPGITDFTAAAGTSSKTIRVIVFRTAVNSVEFTSDHGLLKNNNSDWTDSGTVYASPEWVPSLSRNNPITHTMNSSLVVNVTVKVEPSGVPFSLVGNGPNSYVTFSSSSTSTGADQSLIITAGASLPNVVGTLSKSIVWTISASGQVSCGNTTSGAHHIYVTYGTPAGSVVTEQRVSFVCSAADGKSSLSGCADAVFLSLSGAFDLGADTWGPSPIWLLHNTSEKSQCPGLADYVNKHFQMLGLGAGVIRYCQANANGTFSAYSVMVSPPTRSCTPGSNGHPNPTTHDDVSTLESLIHRDGNGGPNNFEATCLFNSTHYALGVTYSLFAKDIVMTAFPPPQIRWEFVTVLSPITFQSCSINPWAPAP